MAGREYGKFFELDEEVHPYHIVLVIKVYFGKLKDIKAVLAVNAKNGEIAEYNIDEAPEWMNCPPLNQRFRGGFLCKEANSRSHYTLLRAYL